MPKFESDANEIFGKNIAMLLKQYKLNSYVICALLKLKPSVVSDLLSGKVNWKLEQIIKLSKYFGETTDKLIFGDEHYIKNLKDTYYKTAKSDIKEFLVREKKYKTLGELTVDGFFDDIKQ